MESPYLGRGHSKLTFTFDTVTKSTRVWEANMLAAFPQVFVKVLNRVPTSDGYDVIMPRLESALMCDSLVYAAPLLKELWTHQSPQQKRSVWWQSFLWTHLNKICREERLPIAPHQLTSPVYNSQNDGHFIHGDPTLANLLFSSIDGDYRWIDPLDRPYIPGDRHVDLGKLYQSCMGYEDVLQGREPRVRKDLMRRLALDLDLDSHLGLAWCRIHFVRLLPWQLPADRPALKQLFLQIPEEL